MVFSSQSGCSPILTMPADNMTSKLAGRWILFTFSLIAMFTAISWIASYCPPLPLTIGWVLVAISGGWAATFGRHRFWRR